VFDVIGSEPASKEFIEQIVYFFQLKIAEEILDNIVWVIIAITGQQVRFFRIL
jgi:hypothetical protein